MTQRTEKGSRACQNDPPQLSFDLSRPRARRGALLALVAACFVYRLAFGLSSDFWTEDERQVYLIGLQSYARQAWPDTAPTWCGPRAGCRARCRDSS